MAFQETNFSGALATWKGEWSFILTQRDRTDIVFAGIGLSELQKTLDAQGIELVENQKESVVGRKALADKTKGMLPALPYQYVLRLTYTA